MNCVSCDSEGDGLDFSKIFQNEAGERIESIYPGVAVGGVETSRCGFDGMIAEVKFCGNEFRM